MIAALLALAAAIGWGSGDFLAGRSSRLVTPMSVLAVSQVVGLVLAAAAVVVARPPWPSTQLIASAALSGLFVALALGTFYESMRVGSISLVAPIAGTGALVPIAFGLATGDAVTRAERAGFALALLAVVLASIERRKGAAPHVAAGVVLAVVAAVTGGLNVIFLRDASRGGVLWTLVAQRVTVAGFAFAFAMTVGSGIAITRSVRRDVLAVGVIDVAATGCFAAATNRGMLSVVAAIGALFPVATVLLARWVLHERLSLVQRIGVTGAMAAVVLLIVLRAG